MSQVSRALTRAHAAGIVHRDLKPENVFLSREDDTEVAKVLDFGIAKKASMHLGDSGTKTGSLVGTPFYMSPEQARGTRAIDHRSDLFSLAVITFECLTGELPFDGEGLGEVLGKIMYEPLPLPSNYVPVLANGFDGWWQRAAAREPEQRFQTAKEFSEALALALGVTQTFDIAPLTSSPDLTSDLGIARPVRESRSQDNIHTMVALQPDVLGQSSNGTTGDPLSRTFVPLQQRSGRRWLVAGVLAGGTALALGAFFLLGPSKKQGESAHAAAAAAPVTPPAPEPAAPPKTPEPAVDPAPSAQPAASAEKGAARSSGARKTSRPKAPAQKPPTKSSGKSPKVVDFGI